MFWSRQPARPRPVLRTRLSLESLDGRAVPSDLSLGGDPPPLIGGDLGGPPAPVNVAPRIVDFTGVQTSVGWYEFTGRVVDSATVGGLVISFAGIPAMNNQTTTTAADGTFTITVRVQTDGTDAGEVRATTVAAGLTSNEASCYIVPGS